MFLGSESRFSTDHNCTFNIILNWEIQGPGNIYMLPKCLDLLIVSLPMSTDEDKASFCFIPVFKHI